MGLNDNLMHRRLFEEKAGADLGPAMRAHLKKRGGFDFDATVDPKLNSLIEEIISSASEEGFDPSDLEEAYRLGKYQEILEITDGWIDGTKSEFQSLLVEAVEANPMYERTASLTTRAKKPKTSGAATAQDRSEARLTEALARVQQCSEAANAFWMEGNQAEALAALEDLLAESKATRQAIASHAEKFPLEGEVLTDGEPVAESEMVGEDAEAVEMAAGAKSFKRKSGEEDVFWTTVDEILNFMGDNPEDGLEAFIEDLQRAFLNEDLDRAGAILNSLQREDITGEFASLVSDAFATFLNIGANADSTDLT